MANEFERMQKLAGLITESQLNEAEPNIKKIGKYITIETGKYDDDYPDLDRQAISDYLESVIDPKYINRVKKFMNDDENGYGDSSSYFFDEDDRYKDPSAVKDSEVEEWARQEMSYYLFSQPDEFPSKGANKPYPKAPPRFSATSPLNKTSPKLLALLDAVEKDWGKDSDLALGIAVFLITRQDENGELSPANKIAMKKLLSNYKLLNKYGHFLDENVNEGDEEYYKDAEADDAEHIDALEKDMKDDAKHTSEGKMKMSDLKKAIKELAEGEDDVNVNDDESLYDPVYEAKKDKEEIVDDSETIDTPKGDEETTSDVTTAEVDPNVKAVQDALTQAQAAAEQLGDDKLTDQIGNTITFFTRTHVVEKPGMTAESNIKERISKLVKSL